MKKRQLGTQGLSVSEIGLGCMGLSYAYGAAPEEAQSVQLLQRAVELGVTFFDTAEVYGPFKNELLLSKVLPAVRERVVIATKFGFKIRSSSGRPSGVDSSPENIRAVCDASLQRLGIETIDLFYQHRVDPGVPIEDVAGTVAELIKAGKVKYFGLSEAGVDTIRRAHRVQAVSALQNEYSLWTRDVEKTVLPVCRELGIGLVPYSPLGRGFLAAGAGQLADNDFRKNLPRWQAGALSQNVSLFETLARLAEQQQRTPAQLALAWLLHQGTDIVPIPGTTKIHRLEENLGAADIQLSADDLAAIERAVPESAVQGDRYDQAGLAMTGL